MIEQNQAPKKTPATRALLTIAGYACGVAGVVCVWLGKRDYFAGTADAGDWFLMCVGGSLCAIGLAIVYRGAITRYFNCGSSAEVR